MEDTTQQTEATAPASLEDVYKEFNVEAVATEFASKVQQPAPAVQQFEKTAEKPVIPDPVVDPEAFKAWAARDQQEQLALRQSLQEFGSQLKQYQEREIRSKEEADIKKAVGTIAEKVKLDPDMIEIALGAEARKDARFLKVWEQRDANPKAWSKAVEAFTTKLEQKFQFRPDPQLVENQRAVKTAQQAMATSSKPADPMDRLGSLDTNQLNIELDRLKGMA